MIVLRATSITSVFTSRETSEQLFFASVNKTVSSPFLEKDFHTNFNFYSMADKSENQTIFYPNKAINCTATEGQAKDSNLPVGSFLVTQTSGSVLKVSRSRK